MGIQEILEEAINNSEDYEIEWSSMNDTFCIREKDGHDFKYKVTITAE